MFFDEVEQQLTASVYMRAAAADCLEQAQLVQGYHLVVVTCTAGHNSANKDL